MNGIVFAVIPARGGSKGFPNKNIRELNGRPLLAHAIEAARGSRRVDGFVVSTDSPDIATVAASFGARPDTLRPPDLSHDEASTVGVVKYEVERYERAKGVNVRIVVVLQPTTPLRRSEDIDATLELLEADPDADSAFTACDGGFVHPRIMYWGGVRRDAAVWGGKPLMEGSLGMRRQEFEPVYVRNGAVYAARRALLEQGHLVGGQYHISVMPRGRSINVDDELDLVIAEALIGHGTTE